MADTSKLIRNVWREASGVETATILSRDVHPEGVDLKRLRFGTDASYRLEGPAHIVSVLEGAVELDDDVTLRLTSGVHASIVGDVTLRGEANTKLVVVTGSAPEGRPRIVVRDERFLRACVDDEGPLRWILTPQYTSRRVFLHHDAALLSKSGAPVSWFRTTMFDTTGLPENDDGEPAFRMSYNHRTEPNVCYDVVGLARVRFAEHPYDDAKQRFGPWHTLDGETTYHLDEARGGPEEELRDGRPLRNRHEVSVRDGHVSLLCLFDPAPTGIEQHRPGTYSEYGALEPVLASERYAAKRRAFEAADEMVDTLSRAAAEGTLSRYEQLPVYQRYRKGSEVQRAVAAALLAGLADPRRAIVEPWSFEGVVSDVDEGRAGRP